MKRSILLACVMVVAFGRLAFADIETCEANCRQQNDPCLAAAMKFVNDIEVQDAKAACQSTHTACMTACMDAEQNHQLDPPPKAKEEGESTQQ